MTLTERITAVQIMQKFVRMSRLLLPIYADLSKKRHLSIEEQNRLHQIENIYDNFTANPEASQHLIGSDILFLILKTYNHLSTTVDKEFQHFHIFTRFISESDRLIKTWNRQAMN